MLSSSAKAIAGTGAPLRRASNKHRKQSKNMGKFAEAASKHDVDKRGDGYCVAGRWIAENLDNDDLAEFERLAINHKWELITRLSEHKLRQSSLNRHVHGTCVCFDDRPAHGCCSCHGGNN